MATLVDIGLPEWGWVGGDWEEQHKRDAEYFAEVKRLCQVTRTPGNGHAKDDSDLVGEIVKWHRGDGYALYAVVNTEPLELAWVPFGDRWTVEPALIRGLILDEVRDMVERERRLREVFS